MTLILLIVHDSEPCARVIVDSKFKHVLTKLSDTWGKHSKLENFLKNEVMFKVTVLV